MWEHGISQIPVMNGDKLVGTIYEDDIVRAVLLSPEEDVAKWPVSRVMSEVLPIVSPNESLETVMQILSKEPAVLVMKRGKLVGIITKSDIIAHRIVLCRTQSKG